MIRANKTEKECLSIKAKLDKGGDFNKLAKQHSSCPTKKRGGDLG
jgi:peptidyl-prolyl cis-trans isomerase C